MILRTPSPGVSWGATASIRSIPPGLSGGPPSTPQLLALFRVCGPAGHLQAGPGPQPRCSLVALGLLGAGVSLKQTSGAKPACAALWPRGRDVTLGVHGVALKMADLEKERGWAL